MYEPTAEWLFFYVQSLMLSFSSTTTILSFSLSCLSCFLSPYETVRRDACQMAAALNGRRG